VRGELLTDPRRELPELASVFASTGLTAVYSSPSMLWGASGVFDPSALESGLAAAHDLGARTLKMSIGGFAAQSVETLPLFKDCLRQSRVELLIENDQTATAGSVAALRRFFELGGQAGIELGMTFDMGNWHWVGESPLLAAGVFADRVRYVHCKGVQRQPQRWVAVPLGESMAPWRGVLNALPQDVPRAIEYPIVGDDLLLAAHGAIQDLRNLGVV
jgi:sugar phosphate isomerase/epimerase